MVDSTERLLEVLDKTNENATDLPPLISEFTLTTICGKCYYINNMAKQNLLKSDTGTTPNSSSVPYLIIYC